MYRDVDLPYKTPEWSWVRPLLSSRGLQYVQTIRIGDCAFARYRTNMIPNIWKIIRQNSLVDVEFGNFGRPPPSQLRSLLRRQINLRSLDIDPEADEDNPEKLAVAVGLLRQANKALLSRSSIRKLYLTISNDADQILCRKLLSTGIRTAQLQELIVKTPLIEDWDEPTELVLLKHRFLSTCIRTSPTLVHISLSWCILPDRTILLDSYPSLQKLTLVGCANIGPALDAFQAPRLRSLTIQDTTDLEGDIKQPIAEITSLLRRFNSLQVLILELTWVLEHEDVREIANSLPYHAQSLQSLIFGCRRATLLRSNTLFQNVTEQIVIAAIRRCTKLTEIALLMSGHSFVDMGSVSQLRRQPSFRAQTLTSRAVDCQRSATSLLHQFVVDGQRRGGTRTNQRPTLAKYRRRPFTGLHPLPSHCRVRATGVIRR